MPESLILQIPKFHRTHPENREASPPFSQLKEWEEFVLKKFFIKQQLYY
jgi:hypothetical protein